MGFEIDNPVRQYRDILCERFADLAAKEFQRLTDESGIDIEANRQKCAEVYAKEAELGKRSGRLKLWWAVAILLWLMVAAGVCFCIWGGLDTQVLVGVVCAIAAIVVILFAKVHPAIKKAKSAKADTESALQQAVDEAWQQMQPLNAMIDADIFQRLLTATIPSIKIDRYMHRGRLNDMVDNYGWNHDDADSAVISLQSGEINGNPLVIRRRVSMVMGTKTYRGSITVSVRKQVRTNDGRYTTVTRSETLTASVTKPYPEYPLNTEVIYANNAAPDLRFTRKRNKFKNRVGSLAYGISSKILKRKSRNMKRDFAMMSNEEFEVLFTTDDRNNNQQYALLFTPLAQNAMIELIRDEKVGFGDNFDFYKFNKINILDVSHAQQMDLEWDPGRFRNFDYDKAQEAFMRLNAQNFHEIYFALAPLFCIPLYQQITPGAKADISQGGRSARSCSLEHEAYAYHWGEERFKHPSCVTHNILKTRAEDNPDGTTTVIVTASGFTAVERVDYVTRIASDGRAHQVPIHWQEYIPVEGQGRFTVLECGEEASPVADILGPGMIFHRHITSRM